MGQHSNVNETTGNQAVTGATHQATTDDHPTHSDDPMHSGSGMPQNVGQNISEGQRPEHPDHDQSRDMNQQPQNRQDWDRPVHTMDQ